ncbi:471_t:CDS:2, partial [Acaulospora colombiana]
MVATRTETQETHNGRGYSRGTGSNDIPLGATVKMTFTPPNEEVADNQVEQDAKPSEALPSPGAVIAIETPKQVEDQEQLQPVKTKKGKPRKPREPPPPAQQKALVAEEKRKKALEQENAYLEANKVTTRSAANSTVLSDQVNGTSYLPQAQSDSVEGVTPNTEHSSKEKRSKKAE